MTSSTPIMGSKVEKFQLPLNTTFTIAKGSLSHAANVLIAITDAEGRVGLGEAAPFPVLTHDNQEGAYQFASELLTELGKLSPQQALSALHDIYWLDSTQSITARVGVEMALYDLLAQQQGIQVAQLWGPSALNQITTDLTLPIMKIEKLQEFWRRFQSHGFSYLKIKVGGTSITADVERIYELSKLAPAGTKFCLDGNQGFTVDTALILLSKLRDIAINPIFFEQPLSADDWDGMCRLTKNSPIPICADETVRTEDDAKRVINSKAAHIINLKFSKSGIRESLRIARHAKDHKLELMIGGMLETEIAMTASLQAVCGTGMISYCDLDTPFFIEERLTVDSPYHQEVACLILPKGLGLGLTLKNPIPGICS